MAVPAALIPPSPLVPPPPISTPSATTSPPSTTSSPSPSLAPPSGPGQTLFRSELLATGSPGIPAAALPPSKPVYSTPSPVENIPQNNECKMVELRGAKVASFTVDGCELICLPQAFDLFLKHLKLKRLEITPVVCNVEQVRILRGLGAIQPGVNRCKLISRKDFETLYNDCTNARSLCSQHRPEPVGPRIIEGKDQSGGIKSHLFGLEIGATVWKVTSPLHIDVLWEITRAPGGWKASRTPGCHFIKV
ncbi:unnamed protein product [Tetraodon nigroviridis]|uniref:(spotted green pufferfish) hypothetical protein n=1 Tax=Tetraodon nigroviridis TaxID=99883 RepID=Q4RWC9_TETNG|nr:unnamed protein product [Tetraodon nigroviridis]